MDNQPYIAVVGGVNVDIIGTSASAMRHGDSNPGHVRLTPGGVGRNIAEDIVHLGYPVEMISVLGDDANAGFIRSSCQQLGISLRYSETIPGCSTGSYLCLNDCDGDLYTAVNDMAVYDHLTPDFIAARMDVLNHAAMVVVDANIPGESIRYLTEHCTAPIAADPVSVPKCEKLANSLCGLTLIKPNRPEAAKLSGIPIDGMDGVEEAAAELIRRGVKNVLLSLGSRGVYYTDGKTSGIQPCFPGKIVNTTGCGDASLAASVIGCLEGKSIEKIAAMGQANSSLCAEADAAVNPLATREALNKRLEEQ